MFRDTGAGVAVTLAFVVAATTAVAMGTVAHDRGDEAASERDRSAALVVQLDRTNQRIEALRARIDAIDEPSLRAELRRLERLAAQRAQVVHGLRDTLGSLHACSAAGMTTPTLPTGLPAAVDAKATAILEAASTCDIPGLARLAVHDPAYPFEYGLDATAPPGVHWTMKEFTGEAPMQHLVELFGLPMGTERWLGTGLGTMYVWPSAAAYDSWAQVPESEKDAVRAWYAAHGSAVPVYDGNYWGWQVVIGADGAWRVFFQSPD